MSQETVTIFGRKNQENLKTIRKKLSVRLNQGDVILAVKVGGIAQLPWSLVPCFLTLNTLKVLYFKVRPSLYDCAMN